MSLRRTSGGVKAARPSGYTLVICEKPDAARRVAEALSAKVPEVFYDGGVQAFRLEDSRGRGYVVCAAAGHLYGISDTVKNRRVYPVADLEWFPLGAISKKSAKLVPGRIRAIRRLSDEACAFVNACDLDIEGETIGYNILRYACGGKHVAASRAKFSSLTKEEVLRSFDDDALGHGEEGLAIAGRLRHVIDFLWGVNLSRALSESLRTSHGYRTISMGRVQGPTLNFAVEREIAIQTFVPVPYWTARGSFSSRDGQEFEAKYSVPMVPTKRVADEVKSSCEGRDGVVGGVSRRTVRLRPPPPFNLAELQREAFRLLGYSPSKTLGIAERLYLAAMISYPRTGSQKLPKLDYGRLLSKMGTMPEYSQSVEMVLSRDNLRPPTQGLEVDPAHPAIYPTGETARRPLAADERALFGLVVRRFISCFGEDAVEEMVSVEILVGANKFLAEAKGVLIHGWMRLAAGGWTGKDRGMTKIPALREGDAVHVDAVAVEEHVRAPPSRYNESTLLEKMEQENIGTKATRSETISTLLERNYLSGRALVPTELGFALIEAMRKRCPQIISTGLTREIEAQLERIERSGNADSEFFERMLSTLLTQLGEVRSHGSEIAQMMGSSVKKEGVPGQVVLGSCPVCKGGKLWVVRSRSSGKRFVGCTNYSKGCVASAPLPQRGAITAASKPCGSCGWPVVYVRLGRHPWRLCVNDRCPRKVNVYAMRQSRRSFRR